MLNPNVWIKNLVSLQAFQSMLLLMGRALMAYLFIIAGGFIFLMVRGAGAWSIDAFLERE